MEISFLEITEATRADDYSYDLSFIIAWDSLSLLCRDLLYRNRYPPYLDGTQQGLFERTTMLIHVGRIFNCIDQIDTISVGFDIEKVVEPLRQLRDVKSVGLRGDFKKEFETNFIASIAAPETSDEERVDELCSIKQQGKELIRRKEFALGIAKFEQLEDKAYQFSILSKYPEQQLCGGKYDGLVTIMVYDLFKFSAWYHQAYAYLGLGQLHTAWNYIWQITDRFAPFNPTVSWRAGGVLAPSDHGLVLELRGYIFEAQAELEENKTNPQRRLELLRLAVTDLEQAARFQPDRPVAKSIQARIQGVIDTTLTPQG